MEHVAGLRESGEIGLSGTKMIQHVGPGAVEGTETVPEAQVMLEQGNLAGQNNEGDIHFLTIGHDGTRVLRDVGKIVDRGENGVDRDR